MLSNVISSTENTDKVIDDTVLKEDGVMKTNLSCFQTEESNDVGRESSVQDDNRAMIVETNENFPTDEISKVVRRYNNDYYNNLNNS